MRMFLYYAFHSVKNQIKKLFKTWIAIFIVVCIAIGVIFGIAGALVAGLAESDSDTVSTEEEIQPDDIVLTAEERENVNQIVELAVAGITLLLLAFNALGAKKNGSAIFTMADVNLLFPSPMKPQSVLLFKLVNQIGIILLLSFYMIFQIPNLMLNFNFGLLSVLSLIVLWIIILVYSRLLNVLLYTLESTHEKVKKFIAPVVYGILIAVAGGFSVYYKSGNLGVFESAKTFFNAEFTHYIPVYGWIKGMTAAALRENYLLLALYFLLLCAGAVLLSFIIWNIKADFYEDAMARSEETAALAAAVQSGEKVVAVKRKSNRSEKLRRDGLNSGAGASVYFSKAMYNRFRFARFGFLTGTMTTYLAVAIIGGIAVRNLLELKSSAFVALAVAGIAFFRSLGNPVSADIGQVSFVMVPESAHKKVFFAVLGGTVNCALDILPALLIASLIVGENPLYALLYACFILSVDFYSTNVGVFLDLSLPTSAGKNVKAMFQVLCIYLGLIPLIILAAVGSVLGMLPLFLAVSVLFCLGIGFAFFGISPLFIENGRK